MKTVLLSFNSLREKRLFLPLLITLLFAVTMTFGVAGYAGNDIGGSAPELLPSPTPDPCCSFLITGNVLKATANGTVPAANVPVTIWGTQSQSAYHFDGMTNGSGHYEIYVSVLPCFTHSDGELYMTYYTEAYVEDYQQYNYTSWDVCPTLYNPGHTMEDIIMVKGGVMGQVFDTVGDPIKNVTLTLDNDSQARRPEGVVPSQTAMTDINGRYYFPDLDSGLTYTVTPTDTTHNEESQGFFTIPPIVFDPEYQEFSDITENVEANFSGKRLIEFKTFDKRFAPGNERLLFTYNVNATTAPGYAKLEIFKATDPVTPIYVDASIPKTGTDIEYQQGSTAGWDGKMNQGSNNNKYIEPKDGPFTMRLSASDQSDYSGAATDDKVVKVEIKSIDITPSNSTKLIKPSGAPTEIDQEAAATVKLKNKDGNGVTTAIPLNIKWSFEDPDDTSNDSIVDTNGNSGNDNVPISKGGKKIETANPNSAMWKAISGFTTNVVTNGQTADSETQTNGTFIGVTKITFSSSVIGGDNYFLVAKYVDNNGNPIMEKKSGKLSVWKNLNFTKAYKMDGGPNIGSIMSESNIDPAFEGEGYTQYSIGSVTNLSSGSASPEFAVPLATPSPADMPNPLCGPGVPTPCDTQAQIDAKAQHWFDTTDAALGQGLSNYLTAQISNPSPTYSLIGGRYLHPKYDTNPSTGSTNHYPPDTRIDVHSPSYPLLDPDGDWTIVPGIEIDPGSVSFVFLNIQTSGRFIVVGRHEVGHASDHYLFGCGFPLGGCNNDHSTAGLMEFYAGQTSTNYDGDGEFSADSILKLRGAHP